MKTNLCTVRIALTYFFYYFIFIGFGRNIEDQIQNVLEFNVVDKMLEKKILHSKEMLSKRGVYACFKLFTLIVGFYLR